MNTAYLTWLNKNKSKPEYRERMLEKYAEQSKEDGGLQAWMELGDKHPDFVYTV
jgi:hypothetical protein